MLFPLPGTIFSWLIAASHPALNLQVDFSWKSPLTPWAGRLPSYLSLFRLLQQKYHRLGGSGSRHSLFTVLEVGKSKIKSKLGSPRLRHILCLVRACFLVHRQWFLCSLTRQRGEGASKDPFIRAPIPFLRAPLS